MYSQISVHRTCTKQNLVLFPIVFSTISVHWIYEITVVKRKKPSTPGHCSLQYYALLIQFWSKEIPEKLIEVSAYLRSTFAPFNQNKLNSLPKSTVHVLKQRSPFQLLPDAYSWKYQELNLNLLHAKCVPYHIFGYFAERLKPAAFCSSRNWSCSKSHLQTSIAAYTLYWYLVWCSG